jgi:hypothetical protein
MFTPFSEDNIQIDQQDVLNDQRINQQLDNEQALRKQQDEQAKQKAAADQKALQQSIDPKTGRPKSSQETLNPKEFGVGENAQEAANALGGGLVDAANSVMALPKWLDPKFYEKGDDYKPPFMQLEKPITRTVWGGVLRSAVELITLGVATRGVAGKTAGVVAKAGPVGKAAAKPLNYLSSNKTTVAGRLAQDAALGVVADVVSNQSQETNLAASILKLKPEWKSILAPIATTDDMSPAQRAAYNIADGLGIGGVFGAAFEAAGAGVRGVKAARAANAKPVDPEIAKLAQDRHLAELRTLESKAYDAQTKRLEREARKRIEMAAHKSEKAKLLTDETFTQWQKRVNSTGASPWSSLDEAQKQKLMVEEANKRGVDWGPNRNYEIRATRQADQTTDVAMDRINRQEVDPDDAFVYDGGTPERGQAITADGDPMGALRDTVVIKKDFTQAEGTPRSVLTEAQIRRIEVGAPGMSVQEAENLAKFYRADPDFQRIYGAASAKEIQNDLLDAQIRVNEFLDDSGHYRDAPVSDEQIVDFLGSFGKTEGGPRFGGNVVEGREIFNVSQLVAHDVLVGTMLKQVRDIARGAQSVADQVDILDKDSLGDLIFSRIASLARLRKETSMLNSYNLRMMGTGKGKSVSGGVANSADKDIDFMTKLTDASDAAAAQVNTIKQALRGDTNDALLSTYIEFLATAGDKISSFKDLESFFKNKLHGYTDADHSQKSALINELQSMMVHSVLSGPRTPMRAFTGTGLSTFMRPVATILGSMGDYLRGDDQVTRGAFAGISAMQESIGEAWMFAKQRWAGQITGDTPTTKSIADSIEINRARDLEWEAMGQYFRQFGSQGDNFAYNSADMIRKINQFPLFNWSSRAMAAGDQFFGHLLARGRVRQLAFNDAYETLKQSKGVVSDADAKQLTRLYESKFEREVWSADGQIQDTLLKRAQEEVSLTQDLRGWAADFERFAEKAPFAKPFLLFTKTAYNALELTAKHTPLLNRRLQEVHDIRNLSWDDPKMLTYGIKSPQDHAAMKALVNGRVALGYGTVMTASTLFLNGMLTGNGPADKQLRDTWIQMGWRPRSIKVGDKYIAYDALEPFNSFLSTVADIGDASREMGEKWTEDMFGRLGHVIGANVTNKSFLAGITQLNDFMQLKGTRPAGILSNIANNTIPWGGMRNEIGKLLSPGMRELDNGIQDSLRNRNLYAELLAGPDGKLPYRHDILTGARINDYDFMTRAFNAVSPFQINLGSTPTRDLFFRSGIDAKTTFNTGPNNEVLTPQMKSKYQYLIGKQNLEAQLTAEFQNPQMLESILNMERDRAAGRPYTVDETLHGARIKTLLENAKKQAWMELQATEDNVAQLVQTQSIRQLSKNARQSGDSERANALLNMVNK